MAELTRVAEDNGFAAYLSDDRTVGFWTLASGQALDKLSFSDACFKVLGKLIFSDRASLERAAERPAKLGTVLESLVGKERAYLWMGTGEVSSDRIVWLPTDTEGRTVQQPANIPIASQWKLTIADGAKIEIITETGELVFHRGTNDGMISFEGAAAPEHESIVEVRLPLSGSGSGCLTIDKLLVRRNSLTSGRLFVGFQYGWPSDAPERADTIVRYPLLQSRKEEAEDTIRMSVCINPLAGMYPSSEGSRATFLAFTKYDEKGALQRFGTHCVSAMGHTIDLRPSVQEEETIWHEQQPRLILQPGSEGEAPLLMPAGDFEPLLDNEKAGDTPPMEWIGGLNGCEYFLIPSGGRIRFHPGKPAYAEQFGQRMSELDNRIAIPPQSLLTSDLSTSWLSLVLPAGADTPPEATEAMYVSQPEGSALYGYADPPAGTATEDAVLPFKPTPTPVVVDPQAAFPYVPYGGVKINGSIESDEPDNYIRFEQQILSPARRYWVKTVGKPGNTDNTDTTVATAYHATTPSGLLVRLNGSKYDKVLLAMPSPASEQEGQAKPDFSFERIGDELQRAFQTRELFLVVTNPAPLGDAPNTPGGGAVFNNRIDIEGWSFMVNVNSPEEEEDFSNVLIFKSRIGPGQSLAELIVKPETWTQSGDFVKSRFEGIASTDSGDIPVLSTWIGGYLKEAAEQATFDPTLTHFNRIVNDPNWTGVLVLKPTLSDTPSLSLPNDLNYGHHLGLEMTGTDGLDPSRLNKASRIFGLVSYTNENYDVTKPDEPAFNNSWREPAFNFPEVDFKFLYLRLVIRENQVADFQCRSQLTVARWFDQPVTVKEGLPVRAIFLRGSRQTEGKTIAYVMTSKESMEIDFSGPGKVLESIKVDQVKYESIAQGERLNLTGQIRFRRLTLGDGKPFDLMSFGEDGLAFTQWMIEKRADGQWKVAPNLKSLRPTAAQLKEGPRSLFDSFSMELAELLYDQDRPVSGYLPVATASEFYAVGMPKDQNETRRWYGLRFRLQAGTSGVLGNNKLLEADLLLAWGPGRDDEPHRYEVSVYLGLPGGQKAFRIQNVISLQFDDLVLSYEQDTGENRFELLLSDAYLKFLGMRFPPTGSLSLKWFGGEDNLKPIGWYASYQGN
ncbi:hypothetical protein MKX46_02590 [Paenibacillus sp. FSL P4-0113]|uniref:hypothetical protein n=1 Tax=Paenibacillus sp. FSL P4-0113 TaxID=2921630 RepID=UPI0030FD00E7